MADIQDKYQSGQHESTLSPGDLISRARAAAMLDVHPRTLAGWKDTKKSELPIIWVGRLAKYRLVDVERLVQRQLSSALQEQQS